MTTVTPLAGEDLVAQKRRIRMAIFCAVFPLVLFALGIGSGYYFYGSEKMWEFGTKNFNVVFGIPMSIIASLVVIVILVTTTPHDKFTFKLLSSVELSGPSVPILLWIPCFLSIVFGIYLMSGNFKAPEPGKSTTKAETISTPSGSGSSQK